MGLFQSLANLIAISPFSTSVQSELTNRDRNDVTKDFKWREIGAIDATIDHGNPKDLQSEIEGSLSKDGNKYYYILYLSNRLSEGKNKKGGSTGILGIPIYSLCLHVEDSSGGSRTNEINISLYQDGSTGLDTTILYDQGCVQFKERFREDCEGGRCYKDLVPGIYIVEVSPKRDAKDRLILFDFQLKIRANWYSIDVKDL